jgi:hypothetical protein
MARALNIVALLLGFLGSMLVWRYGVPPDVNRGGLYELGIGNDDAMNKRVKRYQRSNKAGFLMLAAAFAIQLVVLFLPTPTPNNAMDTNTAQPPTSQR